MRDRHIVWEIASSSAGDILIYSEEDGSYTVDHLPLCRVFSAAENYPTLQRAKKEAEKLAQKRINSFLVG